MQYLLLFLVALMAIVFVVWVVIALLLRVFAWVLFFWALSFSLAFISGLVVGLVIPVRVLRGTAATQAAIATPDEVVAKRVIKREPYGFSKHYGWDKAWPVYNPYQAQRDATAVRDDVKRFLSACWEKVSSNVRTPELRSKSLPAIAEALSQSLPGLLWLTFVPIAYAGFWIGAWASFSVWLLMMIVMGGLVYVAQAVITSGYRWLDRARMSRAKASVKCPTCYESSPRPSYRCANPDCNIIHRDVSPGPLGVLSRRCACSTAFPTTIGAASKHLTPLCPVCNSELSVGSGARRTIQLPAFGAVGAGKSRLFAASIVAADRQLESAAGSLEPLTRHSEQFLIASRSVMDSGRATDRTASEFRPLGHPIKFTDGVGKQIEVQLMDAAGEKFANWHTTEELTYMNSAGAALFVLDPLALPRVKIEWERRRQLPDSPDVPAATGDQEDAYASVVDRLRSENVKLSNRHLGVVLTKIDVLKLLPSGASLDPANRDAIRQWLIDQDQDGFVRRMESDFGSVEFFAIDSLSKRDVLDPMNPLCVLAWALQAQKVDLSLVPTGITQGSTTAPLTQPQPAGA